MKTSLKASVALVALAAPAFAQDIAQADNEWFTAGSEAVMARAEAEVNTAQAQNIILFVADGNGVGTNYATRLFAGQQEGGLGDDYVLSYEAFPNAALVKTYSVNGQTPDSAPTAGAMNTGIKQRNTVINLPSEIAVDDCAAGLETNLTLLSEIVGDMGKEVGIISTARLTHATPAAVYSRTANRNWEGNADLPEGCEQRDIAAQLGDALESGLVDLALGGGGRYFFPEDVTGDEGYAGRRTDGRNIVEEVTGMGGQFAWNAETLEGLTPSLENGPILGLFEDSHMEYEADRTDEPSLAEMTAFAIDTLSQNEEGFYLEIEAGRVDHANHAGNLARVVTDGVAFAEAVQTALDMVDTSNTLIIVTADHEHSIAFNGYCGRGSNILGLCMDTNDAGIETNGEPMLAADGKPYTVAGYLNGAGSILAPVEEGGEFVGSRPELTEEEATDLDYLQQALIPNSSESHSGEDVAAFAIGPWSHLVNGVMEQNELFHVMNYALNAE
ncbi:alkaline phosphatase [Pseudoroseicyclus tamaricis]|uniref:Alkaline phosphatase n=1 Tax=Pseudoroseicyclus tamaricis TaxID=2705421 RepID=A0A6B2K0R9_9RHOB|nr:alkaline phosphatase [Pseudoroseicyclus tamaricis]NDV02034.1 alkaline phosphatase [Pseudoroseicyclus tamaricis]